MFHAHSGSSLPLTPRFLVLAGLVAFAVAVRLLMHFQPGLLPWNFTPVAAIALFGGACFGNRTLAIAFPLAAMFASDLIIGFSTLSPLIYVCFAAMALLGMGVLRQHRGWLRIALTAIGGATGFYLVTNAAVWATSGMYPLTGNGLLASYVAGLPFYLQGTLAGTVVWSFVLFGALALLQQRFPQRLGRPLTA